MTTIASFRDLMPYTATLAPRSSGNSYGGQTYGTAVSYDAAIQVNDGNEVVTDSTGQEIVYKYKVYLNRTTVPDELEQLTLDPAFGSAQPEIIKVAPVSDENGIHHIVLWTK